MKYSFDYYKYNGSTKRNGLKWSINEILRLEREWELLGYSVIKIAELHQRTPKSIYYKLGSEEIADYEEISMRMFNDIEVIEEKDDKFDDEEIVDIVEAEEVDDILIDELSLNELEPISLNTITPIILAPSILSTNSVAENNIQENNSNENKSNIFINFFNSLRSRII